MAVKCLWIDYKLKPVIFRIIFWMLDVGAPGHIMQHGWQVACAREMGMHALSVSRNVEIMIEAGILIKAEKHGEVILNTKRYSRCADRSLVRMMKRREK